MHIENTANDSLLQILLRSYTGLFADLVPIQEDILAKRLNTTAKDVYEHLLNFSKLGVIHYIPRKKSPYILYKIAREDTKRIILSKEVYEDRLHSYEKRIKAILGYVNENQTCRSKLLLLYFGQKDAPNCGKCDVCLSKNESGLSRYDYERIQEKILTALTKKPLLLDDLIDSLDEDCKKSLIVLRHLSDSGKIKQDVNKNTFFV